MTYTFKLRIGTTLDNNPGENTWQKLRQFTNTNTDTAHPGIERWTIILPGENMWRAPRLAPTRCLGGNIWTKYSRNSQIQDNDMKILQ